MDWYVYFAVIYVMFIALTFGMEKSNINPTFGIRFRATMSDEYVWKATNKKGAIIIRLISVLSLFVNIFFYLFKYPVEYANYIFFGFTIAIIVVTVYLYFYSKNLLKEKGKAPIKISELSVPHGFAVLMLLLSLSVAIIGVLIFFSKPNPFIGVRIGKTFQNPAVWKKVNMLCGTGTAIIGTVFTFIFLKYEKGVKNTKRFWIDLVLFTVLLLGWAVVSAIYAYMI